MHNATIVKCCPHHLKQVHTLLGTANSTFRLWYINRAVCISLRLCQILIDFNNFCTAINGNEWKNKAYIYLLIILTALANGDITASLMLMMCINCHSVFTSAKEVM